MPPGADGRERDRARRWVVDAQEDVLAADVEHCVASARPPGSRGRLHELRELVPLAHEELELVAEAGVDEASDEPARHGIRARRIVWRPVGHAAPHDAVVRAVGAEDRLVARIVAPDVRADGALEPERVVRRRRGADVGEVIELLARQHGSRTVGDELERVAVAPAAAHLGGHGFDVDAAKAARNRAVTASSTAGSSSTQRLSTTCTSAPLDRPPIQLAGALSPTSPTRVAVLDDVAPRWKAASNVANCWAVTPSVARPVAVSPMLRKHSSAIRARLRGDGQGSENLLHRCRVGLVGRTVVGP